MAARAPWSWSRQNAGLLNRRATYTMSPVGARATFRWARTAIVRVHPEKDPARSIDLKQLVDTLVLRGINLPILIRFADILKHRLGEIHSAFETAINEHKYQGGYCCVYPIKVNQQRQVVEEVLEFGKPFQLRAGGRLEAGTDGGAGPGRQRDADHLQRLQRRRVHRDGDAGPEDRAARSSRWWRSTPSCELIVKYSRAASACGRRSGCASSWRAADRGAGSPRAGTARSSG